jgi:hypothetical protein
VEAAKRLSRVEVHVRPVVGLRQLTRNPRQLEPGRLGRARHQRLKLLARADASEVVLERCPQLIELPELVVAVARLDELSARSVAHLLGRAYRRGRHRHEKACLGCGQHRRPPALAESPHAYGQLGAAREPPKLGHGGAGVFSLQGERNVVPVLGRPPVIAEDGNAVCGQNLREMTEQEVIPRRILGGMQRDQPGDDPPLGQREIGLFHPRDSRPAGGRALVPGGAAP